MKSSISVFLAVVALSVGPALASPTTITPGVASPSQKGSLLIFPQITVDPEDRSDTFIEISNDLFAPVHVKCFYVNENKDRNDFSFDISANGTVSWDVGTQASDHVTPNKFPSRVTIPTPPGFSPQSSFRGALICFAASPDNQAQVAFNFLYGKATVLALSDTDARQTRQAFSYNAWSFKAWGAGGSLPGIFTPVGTAGRLDLVGFSAVTSFYDACPAFNNATFMPDGATLGNIRTLDNDLVGVSCTQDLRQAFTPHWTKLEFRVWNSNEHDLSGSYICVNSLFHVPLGATGGDASSVFVQPQNFDFSTVATPNARFTVRGVKDAVACPAKPTEAAGLLTVLDSSVQLPPFNTSEDAETGTTLYGAGAAPGTILWDPDPVVPPFSRSK